MDINFRRVTSSDYDDVIAIRRGIYFGWDYLASRFHSMMETHQGYVAMDGDKMVGFSFITTVDDGETLLTRASRVHEDYEGKGVYRSLSDYIRQIISSNPEIKRSAVAIHMNAEADRLIKKGAVFVGKRDFLVFHGTASSILPRINGVIENKPLQSDAISKIFQSTKLCSVLFPSDRIVSNWVAYRLFPNNIKHFDSDLHNVIATSVDPENESSDPLLSVGVLFKCDTGEAICIDFHGNIGDGSKVREHMEKHIKLSIGPQTDNFFIMITHETKMDDALLYKMMEDFSMTEKLLTGINMNMIEENV
ncbi:histidine N-acetyltransferase-like [Mizuhopecten yessoensis]|uniref:N-acetyltransferase 16 n=1 Tax=Mizuhopecten yessoensis TaxID=6573 RepID=A0A210PQY5_MIZYE|nr:histidine N-acetyltransferase-like [Mizuhopecten yessoensis]OWF38846.1 N-acetyltransferase 16 [Mizuhopecten yessoensis]